MRKEQIVIGDYVHIYNRGTRKMTIFNDGEDRWRFLQTLRYFNNQNNPIKTFQELAWLCKNSQCNPFDWPNRWKPQEPLVEIIAYCLMPNHYHLLIKEICEKGTALFMQKLGLGYTNFFNYKYNGSGSIFEGTYKAKTVNSEEYLQFVHAYIQIINPFELFEGGFDNAVKNFNKAVQFAIDSPFNSLGENFEKRNLSIVNTKITKEKFPSLEVYKLFAKDIILSKRLPESFKSFTLDQD